MLSIVANSWGQEIGFVFVGAIVVGCLCAIASFFRDWLVSAFKIKAVLDKLDEVKRKLDEMERKINDLK